MGCLLAAAPLEAQIQLRWILSGEAAGDQFGYAVAWIGDFNGDGFGDLAVGANARAEAGAGAGKVYLYLGGPAADSLPDWTVSGVAGELLGSELARAGDPNRDGRGDFLIGAPSNDENGSAAGRALLYFGGSPADTIPDWIGLGEAAVDFYGTALSGGRDLNGDDTADFVIGAYRWEPAGQSNTGKVYVYAGGASPSTTPLITPIGGQDGERFGFALAVTGDFTGDGRSDYVVGAYSYDMGPGGTNAGRMLLFGGGPALLSVPSGQIQGATGGELFGWSVADAGDVNGDGGRDILVGAYGYAVASTLDAGRAFLFHGGGAFDSTADFVVTAPSGTSRRLGYAVAGGVDLNGDARAEFALGAPGDPSGSSAGEVYLYRGGSPPALDTVLRATSNGTQFGRRVALVPGFFGGDGALVVGAYAEDGNRGRVYIYRYAGGGPAPDTEPPTVTVIFPNGGDSLAVGSAATLNWVSSDNVGTVAARLEFSSDNGGTWSLIDSLGTDPGSYVWTVPPTPTTAARVRVSVFDLAGNAGADQSDGVFTIYQPPLPRGDVNATGTINSADIIYLVNFVFKGGPAPIGGAALGDVNCDLKVNSADIIYLVNYVFKAGPAPCPIA